MEQCSGPVLIGKIVSVYERQEKLGALKAILPLS
jgi:hypothetical protein